MRNLGRTKFDELESVGFILKKIATHKSRGVNFCNQFRVQQIVLNGLVGVSANSSVSPAIFIFSSIAPGHELFRCQITSSHRDLFQCMH